MRQSYTMPEYRVGAQFLSEDVPGLNSLVTGITEGQPARISGTDPVGYIKDRFASIPSFSQGEAPSWLSGLGRGIVGVLVGLIILALGAWLVIKQ